MILKIETDSELRIDKYLSEHTSKSRNLIIKMIEDGLILVNSKKTKPSYKLKENDVVEVKEIKEATFAPQNIPLDIYYEDDHIIIINKQTGLVVHPGSGNNDKTLVNALLYHTDTLSDVNGQVRRGIVHRLDKDTSGLMIVAKTNKAHEILVDNFKNNKIKREYTALLTGVFAHNTAEINAPIGRDTKNRKKFIVTSINSKKAITKLKVITRYQNFTLAKLSLETGRTHQIRVHMNYVGHPIYNDPIYTSKKSDKFGQYLHSSKIEFNHPITQNPMSFSSPLPTVIQSFIDDLKVQ